MNIQLFILLTILIQQCCTTYLPNEYQIQQKQQILQQNEGEKQVQQISYDIKKDKAADDNLPEEEIRIHQVEGKRERERRALTDWLIAPNTRWCGRGNIANDTYNNLGGASAADKCCRKHDHCQHSIPALNTRYELFNYRPYTLSHCPCDQRFRTCLKMANDTDANTIGKIFFNMVQRQCFILRTKKICQERDESGTCLRHYIRHRAELRDNKTF